ncbi:MAG: DUF4365 domain-containing protein [Verrucomicrobia bacterium]|nr:DUF4365 domain-containing protein [Verrucomicrobiota bacterium]
MPILRPHSHRLEDQSRGSLRKVFVDLGWTVEDLNEDYGVDMLVRIFIDEKATEYSFFVQLKATEHVGKRIATKQGHISCRIKTSHLEHWSRFWEPVLLIIWDAKQQRFYWECVQTVIERSRFPIGAGRKTVSIPIPAANMLDEEGIRRIVGLTKKRFRRFLREEAAAQVLLRVLRSQMWNPIGSHLNNQHSRA